MNKKPTIGITLGDPAGIGTEIIIKSLSDSMILDQANFILLGDRSVYKAYEQTDLPEHVQFHDHKIIKNFSSPANLSIEQRGKAAYAYLQTSINLIKDGVINAVVTAPVNKQAIIKSGIAAFRGHTEMFAQAFNVDRVEMMFVGGPYKTIIATRHIPLDQISSTLTLKGLSETIDLSYRCLKDTFQIDDPRIALCGINPHAGEGGTIGMEEIDVVAPAIERSQKQGINVSGPYAADTLFIPCNAKNYDLIIAMYHDQGLTPIKALYFTQLVNFTIGLPFIRTSTAHGTAENIAGQNKADPSSMKAAIQLACELTKKQIN